MQERQPWLPVLAAVLALAATAAAVVSPSAGARAKRSTFSTRLEALKHAAVAIRVEQRRDEAWRWARLMGRPLHPYGRSIANSPSLQYDLWVLRLWTRRALAARGRGLHPPHRAAWLCIHHGEAPWTDPNPPYYGGLQMDLQFQQTYGRELLRRKGTADHWTPLEQMWVAERAYRTGRGFYPWPNTARWCGLL
jgi:hypothetical protein